MHSAAISVRSALSPSRMYVKPLPSSPIRFSAGISRLSKKSSLVSWFTMLAIGRTRDACARSPRAGRRGRSTCPRTSLRTCVDRRGAREQDHQVRVLHARDPHLLAVDDVAVALAHRDGRDLRRVGAGASARSRPSTAGAARRSRSAAGTSRFCASEPWRSSVPMLYIWPWQAPALPPAAVDLLHDHRGFGEARAPSRRTPAGSALRASPRFVSASTNASG